MNLFPLAVETVQAGLTVLSRDGYIPSPGPVDGLWGDATQRSLASFATQPNMLAPSLTTLERTSFLSTLARTPDRATIVQVPLQVMTRLAELSQRWVRPAEPPTPTAPAILPVATIVPMNTSAIPSWVLPTALGLGVALLVVGGGYYLMRNKRGRSRRRR